MMQLVGLIATFFGVATCGREFDVNMPCKLIGDEVRFSDEEVAKKLCSCLTYHILSVEGLNVHRHLLSDRAGPLTRADKLVQF
jgi:hypothetical protein